MLNVLSVGLHNSDKQGCLRASRSLRHQGFVPAEGYGWPEGRLNAWSHPSQLRVENCAIRTSTGFGCCVGSLWYRGRFGIAALRLLEDETGDVGWLDESELRGNFALFLRKGRHCFLMNDALGLVRLYASPDERFYSTSWLATCAYSGQAALDEGAATEYVLLGAPHSDHTLAKGVRKLPFAHIVHLAKRERRPRFPPCDWLGTAVPPATFDHAVAETEALLRTSFREIAAAFPAAVRAALSGGFDSRLIVAGLLASGECPELSVYGGTASDDVRVARVVAAGVNVPIAAIDKGAINQRLPAPEVEDLVQSALFFDGLPNDGIHDPGADRQTRLRATAGGCVMLNGGGGEIFRNFFHLPDWSFHAIDIVRAFYRQFDSRVFRRRDGLSSYEDRMVAAIECALGIENSVTHRKLSRDQVELIYPLFRCHHWMGVNNSVAARHGYFHTPLLDLNLIRVACRLPLAWKNAGRLESRLISQLHYAIADQPSAYGFRFCDGPDRRTRVTEWMMRARPVFARPFINAARRRVHDEVATPSFIRRCRSLLPGEWRVDSFLDLDRLPDDSAFARALAVEVVWRELIDHTRGSAYPRRGVTIQESQALAEQ